MPNASAASRDGLPPGCAAFGLRERPKRSRRRLVVLCLTAILTVGGGRLVAQDAAVLEYQVKAAFLVKFGSFVEWPAAGLSDTNESFTIGVLGEDPFGQRFDEAVRPERVRGRRVAVRRASTLDKLKGCQVIFISTSESANLEKLFQTLADDPVLIVGDEPDFAKRGGMIGFIKEGGRVRFEINVASAERAGLKLSAKLLQVGKIVVPGRPPPKL